MAITNLKKIKNLKEIEGKFTCLEEQHYLNRPLGPPAMITRVAGQRAYYRKLPYITGGWNENAKRHTLSFIPEDYEQYCSVKKLAYICDTAEEAIAMYNASLDLDEEIQRHTKELTERFHAEIARGEIDGETLEQAKKLVIKAIADILDIKSSKVEPHQTLVELGADELHHVEIIMAIEDAVDVEFGDAESEAADTVEKLINLAQKYMK